MNQLEKTDQVEFEIPDFDKPIMLVRIILIIAGLFLVGLGIFGIIMPLLPGYPFLLAAAACFLRSSETLYKWLHSNWITGPSMRRFAKEGGMRKRQKAILILFSIIIMVPALIFSSGSVFVLTIVIFVALFNAAFIVLFVKTANG